MPTMATWNNPEASQNSAGGQSAPKLMAMRSNSQAAASRINETPCQPRTPTQFFVAVSRKPPSTAQPKP